MLRFISGLCLAFLLSFAKVIAGPQLAKVYDGQDVADYLVSEKYDGVRAIWDGYQLLSRQGNPIHAPSWFTEPLPKGVVLDGELWAGYGAFQQTTSTVLDDIPNDAHWRKITYLVFDAPSYGGSFAKRWEYYHELIQSIGVSHVRPITQFSVESVEELYNHLDRVVAKGGEGLILHQASASHVSGRSDHLLKLKPYQDMEAMVIGYVPGNGRLSGKLGALKVQLESGLTFKIGTGFTDEQRANPPKIGEVITFRYQGLTKRGVPRFASFLRIRNDGYPFKASRE